MVVRLERRSLGSAAALAFTCLVAACAVPGQGPEPGPEGRYVTTTAGLNMRAAPNDAAAVIAVLPQGTPAQPDGNVSGNWVEVRSDLGTGWVYRRYLTSL